MTFNFFGGLSSTEPSCVSPGNIVVYDSPLFFLQARNAVKLPFQRFKTGFCQYSVEWEVGILLAQGKAYLIMTVKNRDRVIYVLQRLSVPN